MNIVNSAILTQLTKTCHDLHSNKELRAVVLTGGRTADGKAASFIGGADIREMHSLSGPDEARSFITKVHNACQALRDLPVPVIARVHGFALGAGLEIMASCDLRVATMQSSFAMPEVRVGIPSVVEAALLPQFIGFGRTRRLLYLAENIEPSEALQWGLVEKVVQDEEELDRSVDEWLTRLCSMGPLAIRSQKRLIHKWESCSVDDGIQAGIDEFADSFADGAAEPRGYMKHFVDRKGSA
ncbi:Putative enoyl-CoA hydratase/isomerase, ClpP/crotonase-like domain superfamily [Septoria linicola]|uniref:Enoyl-CoA hydratase/isomerase, ClpP/crotonase-like domain superfamily n=1 Tax=Septoria linicola TaxID=215465 RepID=A0A9Q9AKC8_9PEZI|nr:Putative enoyl-CoA hydratase/isomerase, ClpP/crotonase-like domain superfamily [Septoria linicola]